MDNQEEWPNPTLFGGLLMTPVPTTPWEKYPVPGPGAFVYQPMASRSSTIQSCPLLPFNHVLKSTPSLLKPCSSHHFSLLSYHVALLRFLSTMLFFGFMASTDTLNLTHISVKIQNSDPCMRENVHCVSFWAWVTSLCFLILFIYLKLS